MTQHRRTVVGSSAFTTARPARSSAVTVLAVTSAIAWAWSWYTMYLEIHRWKHVTRWFRFNPPPVIPGMVSPRAGLPLRALFVCAAAAPPVFGATVSAAVARRRRPAGRSSGSGRRH